MSAPSPVQLGTRLYRVHGPPGCGKTSWLAKQCQLGAAKWGGDRLIVASLTRAAATEVAGRDTGIPGRNVGTLHAHAYRALGHPELAETTKGYAAWNESVPAYYRILAPGRDPEWANPEDVAGKTDGEKMLGRIGILRARLVPRQDWASQLRAFDERWQAWKDEMGRLDFTDLIEQACLIAHPLNPRIVFLDEAQDMSALEMQLALHWATEAHQTIMVGDVDQCLFEWRGSSQAAFLGPEAVEERTLSQSYRVPRAVHAYAVPWVERIRDRPNISYQPRDADGSVETSWATYMAPGRITRALVEQPEGETTMVLGSCAYMLDPLIRELREQGVPFHNPYRSTNGRWNPLASANRPLAFLRPHASVWGDERRLWSFDELRLWLEPLDGKGWLVRGSKSDVAQLCASGRKHDSVTPDYLASILGGDEATEARSMIAHDDPWLALSWWASKLRAKESPRFAYALQIAERDGPASLRETPRVIVGTIHSVKGGEADNVYVFPDLSLAAFNGEDGRGGWSHGGPDRDPITRLFYVAFTRARSNLYLCQPASNLAVAFP
jgi:DNA helicase II / ATP-dependent DNA helicase PcrA